MNRYCLHTEYFPLEADIKADFRALGTRVYNYYNVGQPPIGAHDSPTHGYSDTYPIIMNGLYGQYVIRNTQYAIRNTQYLIWIVAEIMSKAL